MSTRWPKFFKRMTKLIEEKFLSEVMMPKAVIEDSTVGQVFLDEHLSNHYSYIRKSVGFLSVCFFFSLHYMGRNRPRIFSICWAHMPISSLLWIWVFFCYRSKRNCWVLRSTILSHFIKETRVHFAVETETSWLEGIS